MCVCVCVAKSVAVELRCHATALIFRILEFIIFCFVVDTCDLVQRCGGSISTSLTANIIWKSFLKYESSSSHHHHHHRHLDKHAGAGASATSVASPPGNWLAACMADLYLLPLVFVIVVFVESPVIAYIP